MYNLTKPSCDAMSNLEKSNDPEGLIETNGIDGYFANLKERLNKLREQHDDVMQNSIIIMKEIDGICNNLLHDDATKPPSISGSFPDMGKIIRDFEQHNDQTLDKYFKTNNKTTLIKEIVENINETTQKEIICNNLELFKKAKDTFRHMENLLNLKIKSYNTNVKRLMKKRRATETDSSGDDEELKDVTDITKNIQMFGKKSIFLEAPIQAVRDAVAKMNLHTDDGYDGDVDSEYDLFNCSKKIFKSRRSKIMVGRD